MIFDARLKEEGKYWLNRLAGVAAAAMTLDPDHHPANGRPATTDAPLPPTGADERRLTGRLDYRFDRALTAEVRRLTGSSSFLLYTALVSSLKVCLRRYTDETGVAVGSPPLAECGQANALVIADEVRDGESFRELLLRVRQSLLDAYAHQRYPYRRLLKEWRAVNGSAGEGEKAEGAAIFDVAVELEAFHGRLTEAGESLRLRFKENTADASDVLSVRIEYDERRYSHRLVKGFIAHYGEILRAAVTGVDRRVGELEMLSEEERRLLLVEWNQTARVYPDAACLHQLFEAQAECSPDAVALEFRDQQISYCELNTRGNQLAHHLRREGVGPESRVGILIPRSAEMVVALLGVLKAGGAYVPLDPTSPRERLRFILQDAVIEVLLTQRQPPAVIPESQARVISLDDAWPVIARHSTENQASAAETENLAYVIYTSGSTGKPKGVMAPHRGVVNYLHWSAQAYRVKEGNGSAVHSPLSFDLTVTSLWAPLLAGRRVVLVPEEEGVRGLAKTLDDGRELSLIKLTPSHLEMLAQTVRSERVARQARALVVGGESLQGKTLGLWREQAPEVRVINEYGPTETVVGCCVYDEAAGAIGEGRVPIGRPIGNTELYILNRRLEPVGIGVRGELYIGGAGVTRGYLGRAELTGEKFIPHPYSRQGGARLYRTGDLARYLPGGEIDYLGRQDRQVKVRGFRIELGEIEAVLAQHEQVREALVAVDGEDGDQRLVAYVMAETRKTGDAAEQKRLDSAGLREYLRAWLPDYMTPAIYVLLEHLPLTPNGKVDHKALPKPRQERGEGGPAYLPPRTPLEEMMVGIFAEVLKLDRVGISDNFFEIGGHSLLATQVVSRIRKAFGVEIEVRSIFEEPTAAGMGRRIEEVIRAGKKDRTSPLVSIERKGQRDVRLPLSFAQQRLWFIEQLEPGNTAYNCPGAARLDGKLDLEALESVINEIVRRHEALRTRFEVENGEPFQVIDDWEYRKLERADLTSVPPEAREKEAERMMREEARTGFDLRRGPLLRVKVLKLEEERHLALFTMHHIVSDEWSAGILTREMGALYQAYSAGEKSPLPEMEIQYADYAVWQRRWLQGEAMERQISYWRKQLAGVAPLELPTDHPRPAVASYRGESLKLELSEDLTQELRTLSRCEGVTLFMKLLAVFQALLMRHSGQEEIAVGSPIANRTRAETEGLIGFFVNTLVLRTQIERQLSFRELLGRVREVCLGAYAYQDLPFEQLVDQLQPERSLNRSPLFQVMMVMQNAPHETLEIAGLSLSSLVPEEAPAKFDLTLTVTEQERKLSVSFRYNCDLFDRWRIEQLARHYRLILQAVVDDPERQIGAIDLLEGEERRQILEEWNRTAHEIPSATLPDLFEAQVRRSPEAVAVVYQEQALSYVELNRRANHLAHLLIEKGIGPEDVVAVAIPRSPEMIISLLGILKSGAAYLPLDPDYPAERMIFMLSDAAPVLSLTTVALQDRLPAGWERLSFGDPEMEAALRQAPPDNPVDGERTSSQRMRQAAYVIYTSGSTGRPKGVVVSQAGLTNYLAWAGRAYGDECGGGAPINTPLVFDATVTSLYLPLIAGERVNLLAENEAIEELAEMLGSGEELTLVKLTPAHLEALRALLGPEASAVRARRFVVGGEALNESVAGFWRESVPTLRIVNEYGPTETVVGCCSYELEGEEAKSGEFPIGRPIWNTQVYVLDGNLEPAPVGVAGELYIGGAGVARGYLKRAGLTAERFIADPFVEAGRRMYRSGDLARWGKDGNLEFLGRSDRQVKIRGFRIELGEIEAAMREHPEVEQAVALAREGEGGEKLLVAYVVGAGVEIGELRRRLRERLPEYMVPGWFVRLDEMPLTPNGKLDIKALPAPEQLHTESRGKRLTARTPVEQTLQEIWSEVLRLEQVGIEENFFELGGHSLLATQLISRIRESFRVEMSLRSLFKSPTIAGLAEHVSEAMRSKGSLLLSPIVRVRRDGELPLSFAQQRLWFFDQMEPGNTFYNGMTAIRLSGKLSVTALERTLNEIVRRHEALRTRFPAIDGQPLQVIDPAPRLSLPIIDLSQLPDADQLARRIADEEGRRPFDLGHGPLLRVTLLRLGEEEQAVLFAVHHIIFDAWSRTALVREVAALYEAFCNGQPSPLPDLEIQYADYAYWQRDWLQGEVIEEHLSFWRRQLGGRLPTLRLPTDRARPETPSYRGARHTSILSKEVSNGLKALCRREGTTLFMALLAAYKVLLYRESGQEDILIGTSIAGRTCRETEWLIGFFINMLVLRTNLAGDPTFRELLAHVREVTLNAYAYQNLPFDKIVKELQPERQLGKTPIIQAVFGMKDVPGDLLELPGLKLSQMEFEDETARFDLTLAISEEAGGLKGTWRYSTDLFESSTIVRLADRFENLLRAIVDNPGARIDNLDFLTEFQKQRQALHENLQAESNYQKLKNVKPKAISVMKK